MPITLAKIILAIMAVLITIAIIKSLLRGTIEWGSGSDAILVNKSKQPVSYWFIIFGYILMIVLFGWLVFFKTS